MKKIVFVLIASIGLMSCNQEKTAYVDNNVLASEFQEMKDTEARFTKKSEKIRKELDSIALALQTEIQEYQAKMASMSTAARQEREAELMQKQQTLQRQQQTQSNLLREESDQVIDSLITKVKDFVADYGKENGYTFIFGSNDTANIMYAKEGKDITQEVLKKLNEKYKK
ncbi:OmpH family outer membrane protein [Mesonia sp. K7]|uniref:OmpH family outer membrane protein n=1 Tax=Mesonia sp. K7 TaxID=2218606 RepID=UPI000DAA2102|nr:OmpH family outer membrane protein [Mesonia sp. K7]PZD79128.1 OmpH family outer membrane protein [Mesonia sp. K7]